MTARWSVAGLALLALCAAPAAGCSGGDSASADRTAGEPAFHERVIITSSGYHPKRARVLVGGSITWINRDPDDAHTAETGPGAYRNMPGGQDQSFDTHTLSWGEPYTVTFHVPGSFSYHSSFGQALEGTVDVIMRTPPERR